MKKLKIGLIFSGKKLGKDEKTFLKLAKKKSIDLMLLNVSKDIDEIALKEKIEKCKVIYNSTAEDFAIEYTKMLEGWGKKVIDSSEAYYYTEDKWMFFVKCIEHGIPTPETILLCENINFAKKELKKFGRWPVILKRVCGTMGEFVGRAKDLDESIFIIKKFWKKGSEKLPIIAQEFIDSQSYRVTVIGGKIAQTALKENKAGWKATGMHAKKFKKFKVDKDLKKIVKKIIKMSKIKICGIDFLKKQDKWVVLEVNAEPAFDFFENEREKLISLSLNLLKKSAKCHSK